MANMTSVSLINLLTNSTRLVKPHHLNLQLHAIPFPYYGVKTIKFPQLRNNDRLTSNIFTWRSLASSHPPPEFPQRRIKEVDPTTPLEMPEMPSDPPEIDPSPPEFIIPTPPGEIGPPPPPPDPRPNQPGPDFPHPPIPSPPGPDVVPPPEPPRQPPDVTPPTPPEVFPPLSTPPPDIIPPTGPIIV